MIRAELRADHDRCAGCGSLLADAQHIQRVIVGDLIDVLVICDRCGQPTVIPWVAGVER